MTKLPTIEIITHSEDQTRKLGQSLGKLVEPGQVIAVSGNLGAGKTRLAQGLSVGLNVPTDDVINSPTFTFVNQYHGRMPFYHIDVYRLNSANEAETLGLDDYFYGDGVCLIEWADRVEGILPVERLDIALHYIDDNMRRIIIKALGQLNEALLAALGERL